MTVVEPPIVLDPVAPLLLDLVDCMCNELAVTGAGALCWCGLWPGLEVSWEYCGECGSAHCGMGFVHLVGINPYEEFPAPVVDLRCTLPLAAQVEIGALRCLPQRVDGAVLEPAQMADVALAQISDAWALRRSLLCCGTTYALGEYLPVGPAGGCVGGIWTAWLALD
ncbi:MAG TPA: hypothetical protein VIX41_09405 [Acidimicrobiales bacterium]